MEPQAPQSTIGLPLPAATTDVPPVSPNMPASQPGQPYAAPATAAINTPDPQAVAGVPAATLLPPAGAQPLVPGAGQPAPSHAAQAAIGTTPAIADDSDLIEKEWVVKAKQIVEHTKADPYLQSQELNKIKAEYIKKRYNKDIGIPEN